MGTGQVQMVASSVAARKGCDLWGSTEFAANMMTSAASSQMAVKFLPSLAWSLFSAEVNMPSRSCVVGEGEVVRSV